MEKVTDMTICIRLLHLYSNVQFVDSGGGGKKIVTGMGFLFSGILYKPIIFLVALKNAIKLRSTANHSRFCIQSSRSIKIKV